TLRCELVHGRSGTLARESAVRTAEFLVAAEVREVEGKELQTILSLATQIEPGWLRELFPQDFDRRTHVVYEPAARRVFAEEWTTFRGLPVEKKRLESAPEEEAARLLAEEVLAGRLKLDHWDASADQWIERVNLIARTCPELEVAPIGESQKRELVGEICRGASSYREIKSRPVLPVLRAWLNPAMADLVDVHAPERLRLSNGRSPRLSYVPDGPPFLSARIQELFGVTQIPPIGMGRVRPVVHILAPSSRPVQITQDLAGFWTEHYPKLKRELQRKYPKHEWR
ncbi:MAG TPA: ATP-dependent helicase C-terminal domain-containing protein, partial [Planctomycetota bacterium]|nr:ATP-dependent helicase C-terminal domain-containing protein [Planctomycetota bacterium]